MRVTGKLRLQKSAVQQAPTGLKCNSCESCMRRHHSMLCCSRSKYREQLTLRLITRTHQTMKNVATFQKCSNKQQMHSYEEAQEPWLFKDKDKLELYLKLQFVLGSKHTPLFTTKKPVKAV